jgi:hypothetical protein
MAQAVATLTESTCARRGVLSLVSLCARFDAIDAIVPDAARHHAVHRNAEPHVREALRRFC